jgi:hypothetical protein
MKLSIHFLNWMMQQLTYLRPKQSATASPQAAPKHSPLLVVAPPLRKRTFTEYSALELQQIIDLAG